MRNPWQTGLVAISVDLETDGEPSTGRGRQYDRKAIARLVDLFARHKLPATWALSSAAGADDAVLAIGPRHELALRADTSWTGGRAGKARFALELSRRMGAAREAGISVAALALPGAIGGGGGVSLESLLEHGISAVWNVSATRPHRDNPRAVMLRCGLWRLPVNFRVTQGGWRVVGLKRLLRRTAQARRLLHLAIDAPALQGSGELAAVETAVRLVATARANGELNVATLARTAAELSASRSSTPSRSILRAA